jgi:hypothetical protein
MSRRIELFKLTGKFILVHVSILMSIAISWAGEKIDVRILSDAGLSYIWIYHV